MRRKDHSRAAADPLSLARCREILALSPEAGPQEIKKAFRHLAFLWHPDRFPDSDDNIRRQAEERFKLLNSAYQQLMAASTAGVRPPSSDSPETMPSERWKDAAAAGGFRSRMPLMVGLFLASILCAGIAVFGYRYLEIEREHQAVRTRLAVSEEKKDALLALAANRPPPADPQIPETRPNGVAPSTAAAALPGSPAPIEPAPGRTPKSDTGPESGSDVKERLTIAATIVAAESLAEEGRFQEARDHYRNALSKISAAPQGDALFRDLKRQIEHALESEEMKLGANGYHLYQGRWFSPEAYRTEFVLHRGSRIHYTSLKPAAEQFADPLVRGHLRAVFSDRLIHKSSVACTALHLLDNRPSAVRLKALYRWEVWTFEGVDKGELTLEMLYHPREDRWEAVWLSKGSSSPEEVKSPTAGIRNPEIKEER